MARLRFIFPTTISAMMLAFALSARGAQPFITDDCDPADFTQFDSYIFATADFESHRSAIEAPAYELDYGILPNVEIHGDLPLAISDARHAPTQLTLDPISTGIKYRFLTETPTRPEMAIVPAISIPTHEGRVSTSLPLWIEKNWDAWTSYGGGGCVINPTPGQRTYPFGGWLLQRAFGNHLSLGAELYAQGATSAVEHAYLLVNAGGSYAFTKNFGIVASAGHSICGQTHTVAYLGVHWTLGSWKPSTNKK